jgi:hypothetical protein
MPDIVTVNYQSKCVPKNGLHINGYFQVKVLLESIVSGFLRSSCLLLFQNVLSVKHVLVNKILITKTKK